MKIPQRFLLFLILCIFLAAGSLCDSPASKPKFLVFVGTYTDKTESKGIYAYEFNVETGKLAPKGLAAETPNPSWVVIHPNGKFLYAANESGKQSTITSFAIDPGHATLMQLNQVSAQGEDPCYLSFDKTGKYLFVANYTSGNVVVFPILPDGQLGAPTANVKDQGALGPNKERQEAPHAHWVEPFPDNRFVFVADLGLDRVLIDGFDPSNGRLSDIYPLQTIPLGSKADTGPSSFRVAPGTGPRHIALSPEGKLLYVLGELDSKVTVFSHLSAEYFRTIQEISTLPAGFHDRNDAAEIALHPFRKFLFASNRGHDSIAVFAIDRKLGTLTQVSDVPTGGKEPRHFALDPTGQFLLAENQNSNSIVIFRINPITGALTPVSALDGVPSPVCLVFLSEP